MHTVGLCTETNVEIFDILRGLVSFAFVFCAFFCHLQVFFCPLFLFIELPLDGVMMYRGEKEKLICYPIIIVKRHWKPNELKKKNNKNEEPRTHTHTSDLIVICHIAYFNSIIFKNQDVSIWSSRCVLWARIIGFNNNGPESCDIGNEKRENYRERERKKNTYGQYECSENEIQWRLSSATKQIYVK